MQTECFPITIMPHLGRLFTDYAAAHQPLAPYYSATPYAQQWMAQPPAPTNRSPIADLLDRQNRSFGAGQKAIENIDLLRNGASAVVTGQQVTLFGGPLYTLLKAATAIRKAQEASAAGHPHVPIFWLATEDHDLAEADHVQLPSRRELQTIRLQMDAESAHSHSPVGDLKLGHGIRAALDEAAALLGPGPFLEALERCYTPDATFAEAFAQLLSGIFAHSGLIVIDASSRDFHALGAPVLRHAITHAEELETALLERGKLLHESGYETQVLVKPQSSLLFLLDEETRARHSLKRKDAATWTAGKKQYSTDDLLEILETEPERLSPNALLRPVFQDHLLPTAAYIGGPAEIAYFAQSQVLYEKVLGRTTPVLPRLSATLIEPDIAGVLAQYELSLDQIFATRPEELAQRMGARLMPVEGKRKLAAAGNALDEELQSLSHWMRALDESLGRSADVAASKMRYQMGRLRRLAANFQLQQDAGIQRHVDAIYLSLYPNRHLQERAVGAAWFLSRYGDSLPTLLVEQAAQQCPGHKAIFL